MRYGSVCSGTLDSAQRNQDVVRMPAKRQDERVEGMYDLYQKGHSLEQVAQAHSVTRQSVYDVFKRRGLQLRLKPSPLPFVVYRGTRYTLDSHGYYRQTCSRRRCKHLHRVVWEDANGPIPEGFDIHHKDENKGNNRIENLECIPKADHTRLHRAKQKRGRSKCAS